jgi:uncharacterized integral membrane protein
VTIAPAARSWPALLAWGLLGVELLLFVPLPVFDHLNRQAGRPDLGTVDPFAIPPSVAALAAGVVGAVLASPARGTRWAGCCWRWAWTWAGAGRPSATSPTA